MTHRGQSWPGVIVATDSVNDLAVVRVDDLRAPPLWQTPKTRLVPAVGDRVLLVSSPFGLEGTVTSGIVSRVGDHQVITDAPSNPGDSGGPVVDAEGHIVGVLRSGVEEDLSFLVPIDRACVRVRHCLWRRLRSAADEATQRLTVRCSGSRGRDCRGRRPA